jgi:hypothetical protein
LFGIPICFTVLLCLLKLSIYVNKILFKIIKINQNGAFFVVLKYSHRHDLYLSSKPFNAKVFCRLQHFLHNYNPGGYYEIQFFKWAFINFIIVIKNCNCGFVTYWKLYKFETFYQIDPIFVLQQETWKWNNQRVLPTCKWLRARRKYRKAYHTNVIFILLHNRNKPTTK